MGLEPPHSRTPSYGGVMVPIEVIRVSLSPCFASGLVRAPVYRENLRRAA